METIWSLFSRYPESVGLKAAFKFWARTVGQALARTFWGGPWLEAAVTIAAIMLVAWQAGGPALVQLGRDPTWLYQILVAAGIVLIPKFCYHLLKIPADRAVRAENLLVDSLISDKVIEELHEAHNKGDRLLRWRVESDEEMQKWMDTLETWRAYVLDALYKVSRAAHARALTPPVLLDSALQVEGSYNVEHSANRRAVMYVKQVLQEVIQEREEPLRPLDFLRTLPPNGQQKLRGQESVDVNAIRRLVDASDPAGPMRSAPDTEAPPSPEDEAGGPGT